MADEKQGAKLTLTTTLSGVVQTVKESRIKADKIGEPDSPFLVVQYLVPAGDEVALVKIWHSITDGIPSYLQGVKVGAKITFPCRIEGFGLKFRQAPVQV
jgi:hypothetical protein